MEYLIIAGAQIFGVLFHAFLKIFEIDKRDPDDTFREVMVVFFKENKVSLLLSAAIMLFAVFVRFVVDHEAPELAEGIPYFSLIYYGLSLVLGYQGQRLLYKWLDKGVERADRFVNNKLD